MIGALLVFMGVIVASWLFVVCHRQHRAIFHAGFLFLSLYLLGSLLTAIGIFMLAVPQRSNANCTAKVRPSSPYQWFHLFPCLSLCSLLLSTRRSGVWTWVWPCW